MDDKAVGDGNQSDFYTAPDNVARNISSRLEEACGLNEADDGAHEAVGEGEEADFLHPDLAVVLVDGKELPVSRKYKEAVKAVLRA